MNAIEVVKQMWNSQYQARTRYYGQDEVKAFERAKKMTTACMRFSDYPCLAELAPTAGEFEVDGFKIIRRKVDEVDNIYASLIL